MPVINTALTLEELPPPPPGKTGWPWTEQPEPLPGQILDGSDYPRISVVIPSYNQGKFLEETIRSVLLQGYPNLEFIIIDGGSIDCSIEIIKKYETFINYWVSEPDRGQSHAINKGLEKCTGDYIAWMNSSDLYIPGAFTHICENIKKHHPDFVFGWAAYIGSSLNDMSLIYSRGIKAFKLKYLLNFFYGLDYIIPSQSVFVSKKLFNQVGLLNENLHYCMDLDWYARMAILNPRVYGSQNPTCFYRLHDDAKTSCSATALRQEAIELAHKYAIHLSPKERKKLYKLISYAKIYEELTLGTRRASLVNLFRVIISLPVESLSDTRFLGLVKRSLLGIWFI